MSASSRALSGPLLYSSTRPEPLRAGAHCVRPMRVGCMAGDADLWRNPLKFILILAAVLAGDPASTDPSLEVVAKFFGTQADCERAKAGSTGEGKGQIEGKQVLRIVGRCQELSPGEVQQLRDALQP